MFGVTRAGRAIRRVPPAAFLALALLPGASPAQDASYLPELKAKAAEMRLHESRPWSVLLHYKGRRSLADGREFFTHAAGERDLKAELDATLESFFAPPVREQDAPRVPDGSHVLPEGEVDQTLRVQHPQCRFPARYLWLKESLGFNSSRLYEHSCSRLEEWLKAIDAETVSLVFADAYLNNPGSMYGHTFLRLHRAGSRSGEDLLDYTINFAADVDTHNAFLYPLKGLVGAFPGKFSTMPYYMKIQEYNNVESRDLWEYRLAWSSATARRMLLHAWEMGSTHFDYYFFSENCSYQLLTLLEAADPGLDLSGGFGFGTIPSDTLRAVLRQPGLVAEVRYRPSHLALMKLRRERLTRAERSLAYRLGRGADPAGLEGLARLPPSRQLLVLDSGHDYFRYRVGFDPSLPPEVLKTERRLLVRRGALGLPSPELPGAPRPQPPESGHATMRAGAAGGASSLGPFTELYFRGALHDLADDPAGYVPDHQLEMLDARLRVDHRTREPYFETLDAVELVSLSPYDSWLRRPSWTAAFGADQAREDGCLGWSCAIAFGRFGSGVAASNDVLGRQTWYLLAMADGGLGPALADGWRAGGGPWGGMTLARARWRLQVEASYLRYVRGRPRELLRLTQAFGLSRGVEARVILERRTPASEASLAVLSYF